MMRQPTTRPRRLLPWLVVSLVLFVLGAMPRNHVVVCLAQLGLTEPPVVACCSECCHAEAAPPAPVDERAPGEERVRAGCPFGCCIDLQSHIEVGPMPKAELPELPVLALASPPPNTESITPVDRGDRVWSWDTGPPRVDARTRLRSSIVLRL